MDRTIPLTRGLTATIDAADWPLVSRYKWYAAKRGHTFYAATNIGHGRGNCTLLLMHRLLAGVPGKVDHRDGDGLNNRRENLRSATSPENGWNSRRPVTNTSGFKGVSWDKRDRAFTAKIKVNGKRLHLGSFATAEAAYEAYKTASSTHHGEFASHG